MKTLSGILFLSLIIPVALPGSLIAQDVPAVYEIKTKKFNSSTEELMITTITNEIGENESKDRLSAYIQKRRTKDPAIEYHHYLCLCSNMDLGCSGTTENYIRIKFENGDVIKLEKDISETNCVSPVESKYELEGEILEKLKKYKITSIRLNQSKYFSDFNIWYPDFIIKTMRLLSKYI